MLIGEELGVHERVVAFGKTARTTGKRKEKKLPQALPPPYSSRRRTSLQPSHTEFNEEACC